VNKVEPNCGSASGFTEVGLDKRGFHRGIELRDSSVYLASSHIGVAAGRDRTMVTNVNLRESRAFGFRAATGRRRLKTKLPPKTGCRADGPLYPARQAERENLAVIQLSRKTVNGFNGANP
jgi:hypothetical protein